MIMPAIYQRSRHKRLREAPRQDVACYELEPEEGFRPPSTRAMMRSGFAPGASMEKRLGCALTPVDLGPPQSSLNKRSVLNKLI